MSWKDFPFMGRGSQQQPTLGRNVDVNKVIGATLRKLNNNKRRWFVLYAASEDHPASLEYHDNETKWREGRPPTKEIILKDCLNICRKRDSRDSKHRLVIALYTLKDCLSILFEDEQDLKIWLNHLLSHQKGRPADGKIPRPNFEHLWQVQVKGFRPEDPDNGFSMSGPHRLCITDEDLHFFPLGSRSPVTFSIVTLRSSVQSDRMFRIVTGRSSKSGVGTLDILCEDKEIAENLYGVYSQAMEALWQDPERLKPKTHHRGSKDHREHHTHSSTPGGSSYRPRSESCSKIDKVTRSSSAVPKLPSAQHTTSSTTQAEPITTASRHRTTSETLESFASVGRPGGGGGRSHRGHVKASSVFSGSPMSPSPGSYISSESAGSSNSIDESDYERRQLPPANEPATIFEEDSAGSSVDPNANKNLAQDSPQHEQQQQQPHPVHQRTRSDNLISYTPLDMATLTSPPTTTTPPSSSSSKPATEAISTPSSSTPTQYVTIMGGQPPSNSEYLVMTPGSGNNSATGSLKRNASLDQSSVASSVGPEHRGRGPQLGIEDVPMNSATATITSPSNSQNSFALEDDDPYMVMSPVGSVGKTVVPPNTSSQIKGISKLQESEEYVAMSPASVEKGNLEISLKSSDPPATKSNGQDYEIMSPVSVDQIKYGSGGVEDKESVPAPLSEIEESLGGGITPVHMRSSAALSSSAGGARPKTSRSKRSSFCSDNTDGGVEGDAGGGDPLAAAQHSNYVPIDFSIDYSSRTGVIPIPIKSGRISPASSGSLGVHSGTPNSSSESRFPTSGREPHEQMDTKAVSYLRHDEEEQPGRHQQPSLPLKAFPMTSGSSNSSMPITTSTGRSRASSVTAPSSSRFMDIPGGGRTNATTATGKLSPGNVGRSPLTTGHSPNLMTRLDNWFRTRAGSVPSRPNLNSRRRHRTQSEGEKDSPDNQEATDAALAEAAAVENLDLEDEEEEEEEETDQGQGEKAPKAS